MAERNHARQWESKIVKMCLVVNYTLRSNFKIAIPPNPLNI